MRAPRFEGFKRTKNRFELVCFKRRSSQPSTKHYAKVQCSFKLFSILLRLKSCFFQSFFSILSSDYMLLSIFSLGHQPLLLFSSLIYGLLFLLSFFPFFFKKKKKFALSYLFSPLIILHHQKKNLFYSTTYKR